jgi:Family of unknown function (DUF6152)
MRALATVLLLIVSATAAAHHSRSQYSQEVREIEGELVAVHWVNPHVGVTMRIENEKGEQELWRVEGVSNLIAMLKDGITGENLIVGQHIRAVGSPSLRSNRNFLATTLVLDDGTEILLDRHVAHADPAAAPDIKTVDAAAENRGIFRVWSWPENGEQREFFPYTEAALAARAAWDPLDSFTTRCEPEGMPRIMRNPHPFEFVEHGTEIAIRSELYDLVRTVHMDRAAPPADAPASPLGYSTGRWDGATLTVTTSRVNWPHFDNIGTPQSKDVRMVETFTVSADQTRLDYKLTVTDPATFTSPAVFERYWLALGESIHRYNCQVY